MARVPLAGRGDLIGFGALHPQRIQSGSQRRARPLSNMVVPMVLAGPQDTRYQRDHGCAREKYMGGIDRRAIGR